MTYIPQHVNESIVVVRKDTGKAVIEYYGGEGRLEKVKKSINDRFYFACYIGEYLGKMNKEILLVNAMATRVSTQSTE